MVPMTDLPLPSLEIKNFRAFRHLVIPRLARVNLVTGKNNVGKTCLLEAVRLYAARGSWMILDDLLESRDENGSLPSQRGSSEQAIRYLFYGRHEIGKETESIRIGPINSPDATLVIGVGPHGSQLVERVNQRQLRDQASSSTVFGGHAIVNGKVVPTLDVQWGAQRMLSSQEMPVFIPANGLNQERINQLWDSVVLTEIEQDVLSALRIIAPGVQRVSLIAGQEQERFPIVKVADVDSPIPLRSLGEGMVRLFGIALTLATAQAGFLLIDEVESGLHYSVQPDLWRLIIQVARQLNVQVFATTHSWDCIEGFQQAAGENPGEGLLISLRAKKDTPGEVAAVLFDQEELAIATRDRIEVR